MRISDWSSDVCSSDLNARLALASTFQAQFVEQHIAKLLGAPDGERHSRLRIDFLLQRFDLACEFGRKTGKMFAVHLDAGAFHFGYGCDEREIHHLVDARHARLRKAKLQKLPKADSDIGTLGGIFRRLLKRAFGQAELAFPGSSQRY